MIHCVDWTYGLSGPEFGTLDTYDIGGVPVDVLHRRFAELAAAGLSKEPRRFVRDRGRIPQRVL